MYGRDVPEPRYWKALVVTTLFVVPIALFVRAFLRMPDVVWLLAVAGAAVAISFLVHLRVKNDWRAQYTMNLEVFDRRTSVGPGRPRKR